MLFTRTYSFQTHLNSEEIKERLLEQHVVVESTDFEVCEKKQIMKVIPHAEEGSSSKTLPITHINLSNDHAGTKVRILTKLRRIDAGAPYMIIIFCTVCIIVAIGLYLLNKGNSFLPSLVLSGVAVLTFIIFWVKLESGYFSYGRQIAKFVKSKLA